jgi:hypothetical protein
MGVNFGLEPEYARLERRRGVLRDGADDGGGEDGRNANAHRRARARNPDVAGVWSGGTRLHRSEAVVQRHSELSTPRATSCGATGPGTTGAVALFVSVDAIPAFLARFPWHGCSLVVEAAPASPSMLLLGSRPAFRGAGHSDVGSWRPLGETSHSLIPRVTGRAVASAEKGLRPPARNASGCGATASRTGGRTQTPKAYGPGAVGVHV